MLDQWPDGLIHGRRKEGKKKGRKEGRKEGREGGGKE